MVAVLVRDSVFSVIDGYKFVHVSLCFCVVFTCHEFAWMKTTKTVSRFFILNLLELIE